MKDGAMRLTTEQRSCGVAKGLQRWPVPWGEAERRMSLTGMFLSTSSLHNIAAAS